MNTVTFKVQLGSQQAARAPKPAPAPRRSDRAARMLALAHFIERAIDDGRLTGYGDAARVLGVSRARVTQIIDLLGLAAAAQEGILVGGKTVSERDLRHSLSANGNDQR